jgi:hypothetical protein
MPQCAGLITFREPRDRLTARELSYPVGGIWFLSALGIIGVILFSALVAD